MLDINLQSWIQNMKFDPRNSTLLLHVLKHIMLQESVIEAPISLKKPY